jgi:hypothetical protein
MSHGAREQSRKLSFEAYGQRLVEALAPLIDSLVAT